MARSKAHENPYQDIIDQMEMDQRRLTRKPLRSKQTGDWADPDRTKKYMQDLIKETNKEFKFSTKDENAHPMIKLLQKAKDGTVGPGVGEGEDTKDNFGTTILKHISGAPDKRDENPYGYGAGTLIGGKEGGGWKGAMGGMLASVGHSMLGSAYDPWEDARKWEEKRESKVEEGGYDKVVEEANPETPSADTTNYSLETDYKAETDPAMQKSFQDKFAESRELGDKIFKWTASDGVEREYNTMLKGETDEEWNTFIEKQSKAHSAVDNLIQDYEGESVEIEDQVSDEVEPYDSIDDQVSQEIVQTPSRDAFFDSFDPSPMNIPRSNY